MPDLPSFATDKASRFFITVFLYLKNRVIDRCSFLHSIDLNVTRRGGQFAMIDRPQ